MVLVFRKEHCFHVSASQTDHAFISVLLEHTCVNY